MEKPKVRMNIESAFRSLKVCILTIISYERVIPRLTALRVPGISVRHTLHMQGRHRRRASGIHLEMNGILWRFTLGYFSDSQNLFLRGRPQLVSIRNSILSMSNVDRAHVILFRRGTYVAFSHDIYFGKAATRGPQKAKNGNTDSLKSHWTDDVNNGI